MEKGTVRVWRNGSEEPLVYKNAYVKVAYDKVEIYSTDGGNQIAGFNKNNIEWSFEENPPSES